MRKSAIAASAVLATGLMGLGGTAFASTGGAAPSDDNTGEGTQSSTAQPTNHAVSVADAGRNLVNVQAPISADLHEGVANDLNVQDAVHDVVRVGDVVPAAAAQNVVTHGGSNNEGGNSNGKSGEVTGKSGGSAASHSEADASASGNGSAHAHAEAGSVSLGQSLTGAVSSATATVNSVTHIGDLTLSR